MQIIGCDPSQRATGFAAIEYENGVLRFLRGDCLRTKADDGEGSLTIIRHGLTAALRQHPGATLFGIEENFANKVHGNIASALRQREVIGVCIQAAHEKGLHVVRVGNTEAKRVMTHDGHADKGKVAAWVSRVVSGFPAYRYEYQIEAVADATAIAIAAYLKWVARRTAAERDAHVKTAAKEARQ